jgi:8-oxo-dGTP diphosphatase
MKKYVLGFAFTEDLYHVLLIKKNKPDWQKGLLNGIGGKIEDFDISPIDAMVREFKEETGVYTTPDDWNKVLEMKEDGVFSIMVYSMFDDVIRNAKTMEDEVISLEEVHDVIYGQINTISNLRWLIPFCFDRDIESVNFTVDYNRK